MLLHFTHVPNGDVGSPRPPFSKMPRAWKPLNQSQAIHCRFLNHHVSLQNSIGSFEVVFRGAVDAGVGAFMCAYNKAQRCDLKTF